MKGKESLLTISMIAGAAAAIMLAGFGAFAEGCEKAPDKLYRLHIMANSDSEYDQNVKYRLRDYILEEFGEIFYGCESAEEAAAKAESHIGEIEEKSNRYLRSIGCGLGVYATNLEMYFTSRNYGDLTVPAGVYKTLRLEIGAGEGKNWWCVMFPPLCLGAYAEKNEKIETGKVEYRFALYDFLCGLLRAG